MTGLEKAFKNQNRVMLLLWSEYEETKEQDEEQQFYDAPLYLDFFEEHELEFKIKFKSALTFR